MARALVYSSDAEPGYRRRRTRGTFQYLTSSGRVLRNARELKRIRSLAIPPAYEHVWVCVNAYGHLQATGRDARGRKQYRYHARWKAERDASKYNRMVAFAAQLPHLRARVRSDLRAHGMPRHKVVAAVVRLLETSLIRIGNEEYARSNGSFGLTTLNNRHVQVSGQRLRFRFRGKSRKFHDILLDDARLARIVRRCQELPGQALFQFEGEDGAIESVSSGDVNAYIRDCTSADFSAKDFRTWAGTLLAAEALLIGGAAESEAHAKSRVASAIASVAERLGNTATVCRASYVHPAVIEAFLAGTLKLPDAGHSAAKRGLSRNERAMVRLLRAHERKQTRPATARTRGA